MMKTFHASLAICSLFFLSAQVQAQSTVQTFFNTNFISIPTQSRIPQPDDGPANPYPSPIVVSGVSGDVSSVTVTVSNLFHTYPHDIGMLLVGPTGANCVLMSAVADYTTMYAPATVTFDQNASTVLAADDENIASGLYQPADYYTSEYGITETYINASEPVGPYNTNLTVFNSAAPNGTWSLYVYDFAEGDAGWISNGWSLEFTTTNPMPPSITAQPQNALVNAYDRTSFSVAVTGTPPMNYQWSLNGSNILGATSSTFTIAGATETNLGTYSVFITNAFGSTNSSGATLCMYPFLDAPFTGADTYWGQTNTLSVGAWGTGPLTYQWYDNGVALENATNSTFTLPAIQFTNAGLYGVVVTSPLGSVTNAPYQVVVNPANTSLGLFPGVIIQGTVGYSYIIQGNTNLSNTNGWVTLTNITLTQPIQIWNDDGTDTTKPANPKKFYQVLPAQ